MLLIIHRKISRPAKVNFTIEIFEGQDEVSWEASAFQREEVESIPQITCLNLLYFFAILDISSYH